MIVLATDTSTPFLTVALCDGDHVLAEYNEEADRRHAELILGVVDDLLKKSRLELKDVDLLAVANGPGSFTGLRVGVSTWKGLASGASIPLIGVSTLDGLARTCTDHQGRICVLLDAKMQEVYCAVYEQRDGELIKTTNDSVGPVEQFLNTDDGPTVYLGDGALLYADAIRENNSQAVIPPEDQCTPRASQVASIGLACFQRGEPAVAADIVPVYLRQSQAERNRSIAKDKSV